MAKLDFSTNIFEFFSNYPSADLMAHSERKITSIINQIDHIFFEILLVLTHFIGKTTYYLILAR